MLIPLPLPWRRVVCAALTAIAWPAAAQQPPAIDPSVPLTRLEALGQNLFMDRNLSEPAGTACVTCHAPASGFASNNGSPLGVPRGSRPGVFGLRNSQSAAYNRFIPGFGFRVEAGKAEAFGGHFWDGRVNTLAQQAAQPFLAAEEMNNPNLEAVVRKVAASGYAPQFRAEFGQNIFATPTLAFQRITEAIAAFENTRVFQPFSSKYDAFVRGETALAENEARGMRVFMDPARGNCASCHRMNPNSRNPQDSLFTDFGYYTLGIPRNAAIPANANPSFFDLGLCGPKRAKPAIDPSLPAGTNADALCGSFRIASLRNVAKRQALMHNGVFRDLRQVLAFYATRDSDPRRWYGPAGVPNDLPVAYRGNVLRDRVPFNRAPGSGPALNPQEAEDIVAFLNTLSDGFVVTAAANPVGTPATPPATPGTNPPPAPPPGGLNLPFRRG